MAEQDDDVVWEDLSAFRMDPETIQECIDLATGCAVTWMDPKGRAMGVWVTPAVVDGEVWVTTTADRTKTKAWLKDGRTTAIFGVAGLGSVSIVGTVELTEDPVKRRRFLEALYAKSFQKDAEHRENWLKAMDSDGRMVGVIKAEKYITFDERKTD